MIACTIFHESVFLLFCSAFGLTPVPYYNPIKNIALIVLERLHPKDDHVFDENETEEKSQHIIVPLNQNQLLLLL